MTESESDSDSSNIGGPLLSKVFFREEIITFISKRPLDQFLTPRKLMVDFTIEKSTRKCPNIHFFDQKIVEQTLL